MVLRRSGRIWAPRDFLNGWNEQIVQAALDDPSCDASNTNNGNNVKACIPLSPYVVDPGQDKCLISEPIYNLEDVGYNHPITALPGCNPLSFGPNPAVPCNTTTPQPNSGPGWMRVLLQPKNSALFVSAKDIYSPMTASVKTPYYSEVFVLNTFRNGYSILSEMTGHFVTSPHGDALIANRNAPDTWEIFILKKEAGGYYSINSLSNNLYVTAKSDGTLHADSNTVGDAQLWSLLDPSKYRTPLRQGGHNHVIKKL